MERGSVRLGVLGRASLVRAGGWDLSARGDGRAELGIKSGGELEVLLRNRGKDCSSFKHCPTVI